MLQHIVELQSDKLLLKLFNLKHIKHSLYVRTDTI